MSANIYKEPLDYISENPLSKWRESLQRKYGNPEKTNYEYDEWRDGVKTMLVSFQEEIEELRRKNKEEYELDYQRFLQFSENKNVKNERNKENVENNENNKNKENPKKRKFEN